jgi:hypothetical protein
MSGMLSTWPVLVPLPVSGDDVDAEGRLTAPAVLGLFERVREVYLAGCTTLAGRAVEVADVVVTPGVPVGAGEVLVSASVVEVFPDRFTMHVRVRPAEGEGIAAEGRCSILPGGPVTDEIRDELIALAHAARHWN